MLRQFHVNSTSISRQFYVNFQPLNFGLMSISRQLYVNITSILHQFHVNYFFVVKIVVDLNTKSSKSASLGMETMLCLTFPP